MTENIDLVMINQFRETQMANSTIVELAILINKAPRSYIVDAPSGRVLINKPKTFYSDIWELHNFIRVIQHKYKYKVRTRS